MDGLCYCPDDLYYTLEPAHTYLYVRECRLVCVLLCFIKPILGNRYVRSRGIIVSEPRKTHPRSEIADVPTSPCPPLDNLGCPDPHPSPQLRRWLHRSPPLPWPLRTDPATTTLTARGLCPGGSIVWAGPKRSQVTGT